MWQLTREEQLVLWFLLMVFAVGIGVRLSGGIPCQPPMGEKTVRVYVSGAVSDPGWHDVPKDATIAEVLGGAGELLPWADTANVRSDGPLREAARIYVPAGTLDLNRASAADLLHLPGIGPVLAERIVTERETGGPFECVEDITRVPGIGPTAVERIGPLVHVEIERSKKS